MKKASKKSTTSRDANANTNTLDLNVAINGSNTWLVQKYGNNSTLYSDSIEFVEDGGFYLDGIQFVVKPKLGRIKIMFEFVNHFKKGPYLVTDDGLDFIPRFSTQRLMSLFLYILESGELTVEPYEVDTHEQEEPSDHIQQQVVDSQPSRGNNVDGQDSEKGERFVRNAEESLEKMMQKLKYIKEYSIDVNTVKITPGPSGYVIQERSEIDARPVKRTRPGEEYEQDHRLRESIRQQRREQGEDSSDQECGEDLTQYHQMELPPPDGDESDEEIPQDGVVEGNMGYIGEQGWINTYDSDSDDVESEIEYFSDEDDEEEINECQQEVIQRNFSIPKKTGEPQTANPSETSCCVCLTYLPCTVIKDCGHMVLCVDCAIRICNSRKKECPVCRKELTEGIMNVFK
jgi:hypothetical protein